MPLRACAACARHFRADEAACPFCQTPAPSGWTLAGLGAAMAMTGLLAACVVAAPVSVYGAPAPPLSPDPSTSIAPSAAPSEFEPIPPYGVPVPPSASPSATP